MHDQYSHAQRGYLEWYSHLTSPLDLSAGVDLNQDGRVTAFELIEYRYNGFTLAGEDLIAATRGFLQSENHAERLAAVESLLVQIEGDLAAADLLWQVIAVPAVNENEDDQYLALTRLLKNTPLRQVSMRLLYDLPPQFPVLTSRYALTPAQPEVNLSYEEALRHLTFEIVQTVDAISQQAFQGSTRLSQHIFKYGKTEWESVLEGIDLLRGQQRTGSIAWGLEDQINLGGLAGELRSLLVNIITRLLLIVEHNDLVRYTIADWLDDLKATPDEQDADHIKRLLEHLYQTPAFQTHLSGWLQHVTSSEALYLASQQVRQLGENFTRLALLIRQLGEKAAHVPFFRSPLLQSTGYALQVGLLGILVFAGYDHLDEGTVALNVTEGIKEILVTQLDVPLASILEPGRY